MSVAGRGAAAPARAPLPAGLLPLAAVKLVANTALRWYPAFLPTLEAAFGVSTTTLTTIIGGGELAGLSTVFVGAHLDRRRERVVTVAALAVLTAGCLLPLFGVVGLLAVGYVLVVLGLANTTVAAHAWISHRVAYGERGRALGVYELSWALALLVGAPAVALVIEVAGWRGPFVVLAVLLAASAVVAPRVMIDQDPAPALDPTPGPAVGPAADSIGDPADDPVSGDGATGALSGGAWAMIAGWGFVALSSFAVLVVSGAWLDDEFGLSTGGLGVAAMAFGGVELLGSGGSALLSDRLGKERTTAAALVLLLCALPLLVVADGRLPVGMAGLLVFFVGYEYAFVTFISLVSEVAPAARGRALSYGNASGTVGRAVGAAATGWLYGAAGIAGSAGLAAVAGVAALVCLVIGGSVIRHSRQG